MPRNLSLITDSTPRLAAAAEFAEAMSTLASGVVLVTCRVDGRPWGMTVTAFASVSADPPTVLVSLTSEGRGAHAIAATRRFGVSVLAAEQLAVARFGAAPGAAKFLEAYVDRADVPGASPTIDGALAHLDCEVSDALEVADHTVFFGEVRAARSLDGPPLLYHRRGYRTLAPASTERSRAWLAN
jgi:flavin reductase ActVB